MNKPEFIYVIYIASTPEKVFAALTSLKSLLESGQALEIPPSALGIEGVDGP